jgi:hypothetical protein
LRTKAWQDDDVSQDRGGGSGQNIPHLFGPGTPVLVPGFQWSGWSKFMVKFGYLMIKVGLHKGFPLMYCTVVEVFYYCRTYYKAVRVGGEESGGHVL